MIKVNENESSFIVISKYQFTNLWNSFPINNSIWWDFCAQMYANKLYKMGLFAGKNVLVIYKYVYESHQNWLSIK